jgi:hypothetical protein
MAPSLYQLDGASAMGRYRARIVALAEAHHLLATPAGPQAAPMSLGGFAIDGMDGMAGPIDPAVLAAVRALVAAGN